MVDELAPVVEEGCADLLLTGGAVWTGVASCPFAEAVAIRRGRIAAVGSARRVREVVGGAAQVVDLAGKAVLPGFQDAHCHPVGGGTQLSTCDLSGARTAGECQDAIAAYAAAHPGITWVTGKGWSMESFPGGTPSTGELDGACGGRPAYLVNRDGHSAWVSSAALRLAGIDASTPDPAHGRIERDSLGRPLGTLHEQAMELVHALVPPRRPAEVAAALAAAQAHLHSLGVTAWQDAAVDAEVEAAYRSLAGAGSLSARVRLALWWDRDRGTEQVAELEERRDRLAGIGLDAGSVKVMLDGVIETFTASLLEPYLDPAGCRDLGSGHLFLEPEAAYECVAALSAARFQAHFHAIGDRAVRLALDAVGRAAPGAGGLRHHVAHLQLVHPDDLGRFHRLGVAANAQPFWACNEPQMTELTVPFLGAERAGWQYPFASLADRGAVIACGSDWPVSTADPLEQIAVAVARALPGAAHAGAPADAPFLPAERLGLVAALHGFTTGSAFVNHLDARTGTVEPGKLADLVVLEHDPFVTGIEHLDEARVLLTLVGGEAVFERGGL